MILILSEDACARKTVSDMLYILGVICDEHSTSDEILPSASLYRAVFIALPGENIEGYKQFVRRRLGNIPIFTVLDRYSLRDSRSDIEYAFKYGEGIPQILSSVIKICKSRSLPPPCEYKRHGLDASFDLCGVYYNGRLLSLTKTETMIIRALIISYPKPLYASGILTLAFRSSRTPEVANVRTHISVINKKLLFLTGRRFISSNEAGKYILTEAKTPATVS